MRRSRCTRPNESVSGVATIPPGYGRTGQGAPRRPGAARRPRRRPPRPHRRAGTARPSADAVAASWWLPWRADRRDPHVRAVEGGAHPQEVGLAVGPAAHVGVGDRPDQRAGRGRRGRPCGAAPGRASSSKDTKRRHRVAGQPEDRGAVEQAERERLGRADGDLHPVHRRDAAEHRLHHVGLAHAHAAARHEHVAAGRALAQAGLEHGLVVGHPAEVDRLGAGRRPPGRRASAGSSRGSGRGRGARPAARARRRWRAGPTRGRGTTVTSVRPTLASTPRWVGRSRVPAGTTSSPACTSSPAPRTAVPGSTCSVRSTSSGPGRAAALDHHHRVGPVGHRRAGHDPDRLARADRPVGRHPGHQRWRSTRRRTGAAVAGPGGVGGPHREPVHRRVHERRHRLARGHRLRGHAPDRVGQRHRPRRQHARTPRAPPPSPHRAGSRRQRYDRRSRADCPAADRRNGQVARKSFRKAVNSGPMSGRPAAISTITLR